MNAASLVGIAEHYAAFVKLCRLRIEALGITYETVDALAGFPARYTATLLCGGKAMSVYSMFTMARVLALMPAFHHDEDQHELLQAREDWIAVRRKGPRWRAKHGQAKHRLGPDYFRIYGQRGGMIRARKLSKRARSEIARNAAQARWSNGQ